MREDEIKGISRGFNALGNVVAKEFGSIQKFRREFSQAAISVEGWVDSSFPK